jgi:hypothetical protein
VGRAGGILATFKASSPRKTYDVPPQTKRDLSLADWLKDRVQHVERACEHLDENIIQYSCLPERYAMSHYQMYTFGMHLHVWSFESNLVTRDSCVIVASTQQHCWGIRNGRPIEITVEHVGFIKEMLELEHQNHCTTILLCEWVKPARDAQFPNIERHRYGFTLANFNHMDSRVHSNSFAFPLNCQQVLLSDDPTRRGWKIVFCTDVRGRRQPIHFLQPTTAVIVVGNDEDFEGLQPTIQKTKLFKKLPAAGGMYVTTATNTTTTDTQEEE